jgi:hypothetical protein
MANLAFSRFHNCFVLVQNQQTATDAEWADWIKFVLSPADGGGNTIRVLVFSAGGSPTPKQRSQIHRVMPRTQGGVYTAVVIASLVGRSVVNAMSLFNPKVRAFAPTHVQPALDYLQIPSATRMELLTLARQLHAAVQVPFDITL